MGLVKKNKNKVITDRSGDVIGRYDKNKVVTLTPQMDEHLQPFDKKEFLLQNGGKIPIYAEDDFNEKQESYIKEKIGYIPSKVVLNYTDKKMYLSKNPFSENPKDFDVLDRNEVIELHELHENDEDFNLDIIEMAIESSNPSYMKFLTGSK